MFTNFNHSTDIQVQLGPTHLPQLFTLSLQPCPSDCQLKDSRVDAISRHFLQHCRLIFLPSNTHSASSSQTTDLSLVNYTTLQNDGTSGLARRFNSLLHLHLSEHNIWIHDLLGQLSQNDATDWYSIVDSKLLDALAQFVDDLLPQQHNVSTRSHAILTCLTVALNLLAQQIDDLLEHERLEGQNGSSPNGHLVACDCEFMRQTSFLDVNINQSDDENVPKVDIVQQEQSVVRSGFDVDDKFNQQTEIGVDVSIACFYRSPMSPPIGVKLDFCNVSLDADHGVSDRGIVNDSGSPEKPISVAKRPGFPRKHHIRIDNCESYLGEKCPFMKAVALRVDPQISCLSAQIALT
ncbi:unnamed protein product, partial [Protopolystoma xenopodis]